MSRVMLGCIADDVTGATDLANNLVRAGMRVMQTIGVPQTAPGSADDVDAIVVAQKTRTIPVADAVEKSLRALTWLRDAGARQIYFKYCSTFDSTPEGNIGPVTDALMDALGCDFTIACPAFPETGRTIYKGNLFVGDAPLNESGMRDHPLTPMTDANLIRVLQPQTRRRVGLIDYRHVVRGAQAIGERIAQLRQDGVGIAIVDVVNDADLMAIGEAVRDLPLVTAGSGIAIGLPQNFGIERGDQAARLPAPQGAQAIVSGSCSTATNAQVADFIARGGVAFRVDPLALIAGDDVASSALDWTHANVGKGPLLVYATASPEAVRAAQRALGAEKTGELVERTLARIACGLVEQGVRQLIVAGGETSGACLDALGISRMRIGPQIAAGVPWCFAETPLVKTGGLHVTLKSGNFGAREMFSEAFELLKGGR
jgi:3-dehydrotetronate 4-kinase